MAKEYTIKKDNIENQLGLFPQVDPFRLDLRPSPKPVLQTILNDLYSAPIRNENGNFVPMSQVITALNQFQRYEALQRGVAALGNSVRYETYYSGKKEFNLPDETLAQKTANCNDAVVYTAVLGEALSIPTKAIIVWGRYLPHSEAVYWNGEGWNALNPVALKQKTFTKILPDGSTVNPIRGVLSIYDYQTNDGKGALTPAQAIPHPYARIFYTTALTRNPTVTDKLQLNGIGFSPLHVSFRSATLLMGIEDSLYPHRGMLPMLPDTEGYRRWLNKENVASLTLDSQGVKFDAHYSNTAYQASLALSFDYNSQENGSPQYNGSQSVVGGLRMIAADFSRSWYIPKNLGALALKTGVEFSSNFDPNYKSPFRVDPDSQPTRFYPSGEGEFRLLSTFLVHQKVGESSSIYLNSKLGLIFNDSGYDPQITTIEMVPSTVGVLGALVVGSKLKKDYPKGSFSLMTELRFLGASSWDPQTGKRDDGAWGLETGLRIQLKGVFPLISKKLFLIQETNFDHIIDPRVRWDTPVQPGFIVSAQNRLSLAGSFSNIDGQLSLLSSLMFVTAPGNQPSITPKGIYDEDVKVGVAAILNLKNKSPLSSSLQLTSGLKNNDQFFFTAALGGNISLSNHSLGIQLFLTQMSGTQPDGPDFRRLLHQGGVRLTLSK